MIGENGLFVFKQDDSFYRILELTNIPRPGMREKQPFRFRAEPSKALAVFVVKVFHEESDQGQDIFGPFPQWRQINAYGCQPKEEVSSKLPLFARLPKVRVACRENSNVHGSLSGRSEWVAFPLLWRR